MHAEILAIGDEITSGRLLDTNSQWLSQRLEELGVRVLYHTTVGDELAPSIDVIRRAIERADVVVATGGLGPTADDLTREAVAAAAGRKLVLVPEALEHIRRLFARHKRPMPRQNELQAMFPEGSRVVPNPHGTAPGIDLEVPRGEKGVRHLLPERPGGCFAQKVPDPFFASSCRIFALPGVPAEMREMWGYVVAALRGMGAGQRVICRRNIKCFGAGESQIESMLPDLIRRGRSPTVGINASRATIILRIAAEGATEDECRALIEPTAAIIRASLGTLVFGEGDDELQDMVVRLLGQRGRTLATAEIGTAGMVAQWLTSADAGKTCYRGGLAAPDAAALIALVGLDPGLLADQPLDSEPVARAMAAACRERFGADYGLAVGGFPAAATSGSGPNPVFFALADAAGTEVLRIPFAMHPDILTVYLAKHAVNMARLALLREQA